MSEGSRRAADRSGRETSGMAAVPVVIYAVKSSPDEKGSVADQLRVCEARVNELGGREIVGTFSEDKASGYLGNRGAQLAAALKAAEAAAPCELWVRHTSRLGRGTGAQGEARALGALLYELKAAGVTARSVDDDEFASNEILWSIGSVQASGYSQAISSFTRAGKERARQANKVMGAAPHDGYKYGDPIERDGKVWRLRVIDEDRAPVIRKLFTLAQTQGAPSVAAALNEAGYRRRSGAPWTRRAVQALLARPVYAGRLNQLDGSPIPAIIDGALFDAVHAGMAERAKRHARPDGRPRGGRPTTAFALAKLAVCARCGAPMYARKRPHVRKDGTQQRHYVCSQASAKACDAPRVDASVADSAMLPHLRSFCVDFNGWVQTVTGARQQETSALNEQMATLRAKLDTLARAKTGAHDRYVAALAAERATAADVALEALGKITADHAQTAASLDELTEASASRSDARTISDDILDWWHALSAALRGAADAGSVAEVNRRLREVLAEVQMDTLPDGSVQLLAVFSDRGEFVFPVDENAEPMFDETPDFYPDMVAVYANLPERATAPPLRGPFSPRVAAPPLIVNAPVDRGRGNRYA